MLIRPGSTPSQLGRWTYNRCLVTVVVVVVVILLLVLLLVIVHCSCVCCWICLFFLIFFLLLFRVVVWYDISLNIPKQNGHRHRLSWQVRQQQALPTIGSYMKLYTSLQTSKYLANYQGVDMGVEAKIGGKSPNHPFVHRGLNHDFHHPFWGENPLIFGSTPIWIWHGLIPMKAPRAVKQHHDCLVILHMQCVKLRAFYYPI